MSKSQTPGYGRPVLGRDGAPKKAQEGATPIHNGMRTSTKSGIVAAGGDHSSAVDALTGMATVPGKPGAVATAHPFAKPPTTKNYQPR